MGRLLWLETPSSLRVNFVERKNQKTKTEQTTNLWWPPATLASARENPRFWFSTPGISLAFEFNQEVSLSYSLHHGQCFLFLFSPLSICWTVLFSGSNRMNVFTWTRFHQRAVWATACAMWDGYGPRIIILSGFCWSISNSSRVPEPG